MKKTANNCVRMCFVNVFIFKGLPTFLNDSKLFCNELELIILCDDHFSDEYYQTIATLPVGAQNIRIEEATASSNNLSKLKWVR